MNEGYKMTDRTIQNIIIACERAIEREKKHANIMTENKPNNATRIEREKEIFILGVQAAYFEIMRQFNKL